MAQAQGGVSSGSRLEDAAEQTAQVRWAMAALQRFLDAPYTINQLRAARVELDWAVRWRDEALDYACYAERKTDMLYAMDNLICVCRVHFKLSVFHFCLYYLCSSHVL